MIEGSKAELKMVKALKKGMIFDKNEYKCKIESYDNYDEKLHIKIDTSYITKLSLDARYQCIINTDKNVLMCEGMIKERYEDETGSKIEFFIENGFYEK